MTLPEFLALSTDAQLREERLAIMVESGMGEEEAKDKLDRKQGELWKS